MTSQRAFWWEIGSQLQKSGASSVKAYNKNKHVTQIISHTFFGFSNRILFPPFPVATQPLLLRCCRLSCVSVCRTRRSSTSRPRAKLRPRTSSRRQPSRPHPSRAPPRPTALLERRGAPPAGVYNMARTQAPPTRNLELGPLGPPQALWCSSQSTRLVGLYGGKNAMAAVNVSTNKSDVSSSVPHH